MDADVRTFVIKGLRFCEDVKIGEDALFCAMAYQRAEKAAFLNEYLYNYRKVSSSADRRFRPDIEETFENLLKHTYEFLSRIRPFPGKTPVIQDLCMTVWHVLWKKSLSIGKIRQGTENGFYRSEDLQIIPG